MAARRTAWLAYVIHSNPSQRSVFGMHELLSRTAIFCDKFSASDASSDFIIVARGTFPYGAGAGYTRFWLCVVRVANTNGKLYNE